MLPRTTRMATYLSTFAILLAALLAPLGAPASATAVSTAPEVAAAAPALASDGPLTIPLSQQAPKIDGKCTEYADAVTQTFDDGGGAQGTVFLKHNGTNLYVCMRGKPGTFKERFGSLYLDPQGDGAGYQFAKPDDYALRINIPGTTKKSYHGTGVANGYVLDPSLDTSWVGAAPPDPASEVVEWSVSLSGFKLGLCGRVFGVATYHHWFSAVGDDYGWPSNQFFDQPGTWQLATLQGVQPCVPPGQQRGKIAYIFRGNTADAASYYNLLVGAGYTVDLIPLGSVMTTVFVNASSGPVYQLIIIADDTGDLDHWGSAPPPPGISDDQVARIKAAATPIIGLGEGGYAFFGKLHQFIGWPNGWHGPEQQVNKAAGAPADYYTGVISNPVDIYTTPGNAVGIYLNPAPLPSDVVPIGLENPTKDHASIIQQGCRLLWGFSDNPNAMATDGRTVFLNAVAYLIQNVQCQPEPPPPPLCTVTKSADPASGTTVAPGQVIRYTITYINCQQIPVKLVDKIPPDTLYVPGSASDGIVPGADGSLVWPIPASPALGSSGTKTFKVLVADTACRNERRIVNQAMLLIPGGAPVLSNIVTHLVRCPPIILPNNDPPYAEQDVQIDPYPLFTGVQSKFSVKLTNSSATPQAVKVSFQLSSDRFGIGLNFNNTIDTKLVTIPAGGNVIVETHFTPISSGHYCLQIKIEDNSATPKYLPIYTQRNLDVNESLKPGVKDDLPFKVANPLTTTANINLVVVNTCPGWTATVSPAVLTAVGPNSADVRNATLSVTPPNPATLGSGCHIDVQGWIGDKLIGGIRKLDVPPVHLPPNVNPPWLESEIKLIPYPLVPGQPTQICVTVQNPTATPHTVTIVYEVAGFGVGTGFTTVGTQVVTLPPFSNGTYCITWTPTGTASQAQHTCVRITLKQPGYQDMHSQRNFDSGQGWAHQLDRIDVPFQVRNPDLVSHTLQLSPTIYGIDPFWKIKFLTDPGDPPPNVLQPGQTVNLHLRLVPAVAKAANIAPAQAPGNYRFGDVSRVDVAALLDGEQLGGITFELIPPNVWLPLIRR
ncbi:MAG: hypothetical protein ACJ8CR_06110 [Roseiflexaceae bacterium]